MSELSQKEISSAFKIEQAILKALASKGQKPTADRIGVDESYVSKLKSEDQKINIKRISQMLVALGFEDLTRAGYVVERREDAEYKTRCTIQYLESSIAKPDEVE